MIAVFRPTHRELSKKLREARSAVEKKRAYFARPDKVVGELMALNLSANEVWGLIEELLGEVEPEDYAGTRPPQKSYEKEIAGKELFAFCWDSTRLRERMYIKFVIVEGNYYYVSLHKDKEPLGV